MDKFKKVSRCVSIPKGLDDLISKGDASEIVTFLLEENYDRISDGTVESLIRYRKEKLHNEVMKIIRRNMLTIVRDLNQKLSKELSDVMESADKLREKVRREVVQSKKKFRRDLFKELNELCDDLANMEEGGE